ncbi:MAG TPA: type II toxin-antitoxin system Phd/YefM family antitoxin [Rhizomicrobium sp.]|jgi:prevent-host-death family protein|nr:type II toxin-antitoxin system Phd/YefM family antitoxin [Bryobacteraceae bacterium]HVE05382.1 type II toxin-antitoxin system Phd/YefM family antitoxin [Rhizomicrobium sp.]
MKTMNLRDANQQFSRLVREVEDSGQTVVVLRNGRPVVKISAMVPKPLARTPEQDAALARLLDPKNHFRSPQGWTFDKQEIWDEQINRHAVVRSLPDKTGLKKPKKSRHRG